MFYGMKSGVIKKGRKNIGVTFSDLSDLLRVSITEKYLPPWMDRELMTFQRTKLVPFKRHPI